MVSSWFKSGIWHISFSKYLTTLTHQPISCCPGVQVGLYHSPLFFNHLAEGFLTLGTFASCETSVWEFMRRDCATLGQRFFISQTLKLTITRLHACLKSNYSYERGNTTAILQLKKIAWIMPVAKPLKHIRNEQKQTKANTNGPHIPLTVQLVEGPIQMCAPERHWDGSSLEALRAKEWMSNVRNVQMHAKWGHSKFCQMRST